MTIINENYLRLPGAYLFSEIARRIGKFKDENPDTEIIRLGIGDVSRPLVPAVIERLHQAVDEMADPKSFRGYGPEQGYSFLIDKIIANDFRPRGIELDADEVFVSDGAKCDTGNIQEIFGIDNIIAIKKINLSEREKAIELANRLKTKNISPIVLIAVECPLCGEKSIAPKVKGIEPSTKIKKAQFRTVSSISKKATTQMRAQLKNSPNGKNFFQRFPIWMLLLAGAVLLIIIATVLSQLGII